jgi:hypothetical protein
MKILLNEIFRKSQVLVITFCFMGFYSCKTQITELDSDKTQLLETITKEQNTQDFVASVQDKAKVVDGRFYFANTIAYFDMLHLLANKNDNEYEQFEKKFGFASLRNFNHKLAKDSSQIRFKDFNFPPQVATLLNQDGEIQIGDTLMVYHGNMQYFMLKSKSNFINALRKGQLSEADMKEAVLLKRYIKPFEIRTLPAPIGNGRAEAYPHYLGQNVGLNYISEPEYSYGGANFRMVFEIGHSYIYGYGCSSSAFYTRINIEYYQYSIWGSYYLPVGENTDRVIYSLNASGISPALAPGNAFSIANYSAQSLNSTQGLYRTLLSVNVCSNAPNYEWVINSFVGDYMGRHYSGSGAVIGYHRQPNLQF